MAQVHVVGAGLAGLACGIRLAAAGHEIVLYEAAGHAGGRCRSLHDRTLDRLIDNGNHLLLSANRAALGYLDLIGARDRLTGPGKAAFPFVDLATGRRWTLRPNRGPLPWWIFSSERRIPNTRPADYLSALRLVRAGRDSTVAACVAPSHPLFAPLWEPLAVAVLNTAPAEGSATLLRSVLVRTFARGGAACRPLVAREGLSATFVEPGLRYLAEHGAAIRFNTRLRGLSSEGGRAVALDFGDGPVRIAAEDNVVLAVPAPAAASLLPGLRVPAAFRTIVNAHFRLPASMTGEGEVLLLGLVGGVAQWLFIRGDVVSITVSAADDVADWPAEEISGRLWSDTARALDLPSSPAPPGRVIKERRATFAQTPNEAARRPPARTAWSNLFLAGDWTDTGLPATIEGAVQSGFTAADLVMATAGRRDTLAARCAVSYQGATTPGS